MNRDGQWDSLRLDIMANVADGRRAKAMASALDKLRDWFHPTAIEVDVAWFEEAETAPATVRDPTATEDGISLGHASYCNPMNACMGLPKEICDR